MSRSLRTMVVATAALVAMLTFAAIALADAPKFHAVSSSVNNAGALVVNWDERGLGNENIDYTLTADATATYACINRGGKHPQAANQEAFEGSVSAGGSFEAKNGRVTASLTTGPLLAPQFTCPSGQQRVLAAVSYTNIVLCDTTNNVCTPVPDASRTFFDV
jgi:hypothetical protein